MTPPDKFPTELLRAVAEPNAGRVVLITGAGCSFEPPTNLPLATKCSTDAHAELVADGVLANGDCRDPGDLSLLADTVKARTGGQSELVKRLPRNQFRLAAPNEGHLIAAALLREHVLGCVMTLNFDLAFDSALSQLGASEVTVVAGPEQHGDLGLVSVVYLHRNVNAADMESWILTTEALNDEWKGEWEEAITQRVVSTPVNVFVGLGSPAAVLIDSVRRLRQVILEGIRVFQVDPVAPEDSAFFSSLDIPESSYVQMGWTDFMITLAQRVVTGQCRRLELACTDLTRENKWDDVDASGVLHRLRAAGLVSIGRMRARFLLSGSPYLPEHGAPTSLIADLVLAAELLERNTGLTVAWCEDGVVELHRDGVCVAAVVLASGGGAVRWLALELRLQEQDRFRRLRAVEPTVVVVCGVVGMRPSDSSLPQSIAAPTSRDDIVAPNRTIQFIEADDIRQCPSLLDEVLL